MVTKLARSGGPMHQVSSSCEGTGRSSFCSAYWIEPVMPGFGSLSVPSRSKKIASMLSRSVSAKPSPSWHNAPSDRDRGRRRAGAIGLLKAVIAAVEARDHARAAIAGRGLGVDQRLHLVAP